SKLGQRYNSGLTRGRLTNHLFGAETYDFPHLCTIDDASAQKAHCSRRWAVSRKRCDFWVLDLLT
ncbi:MAG: hypothetical protein AAF479_18250, partial [Pseudomonadota bacterium]